MAQTDTSILYNPEYLAEKARQLSQGRELITVKGPVRELRPILEESSKTLTDVYRTLSAAAKQVEEISPAGEWIIDNFYIIQEQLQLIKEDFPTSYYRVLPRLKSGPFENYPRVYEIMHELATLTDNVLDKQNVELFVRAYQEREHLSIGELWAVPIMLRFILVQRLEMRAKQILENRQIRREANEWVGKIIKETTNEPTNSLTILADMAMQRRPLDPTFLVVIANKLQTSGLLRESERIWFDWQFRAWQTTLEEETRNYAQRQTQIQVSVRNAVVTLREASEVDWSSFVENSSVVEQTLRLDPSGIYPDMDFKTRDLCRKKVERLAKRSVFTEFEIAEQALLLAEGATNGEQHPDLRKQHIGYYLIGPAQSKLEEVVGYRMYFLERLRRFAHKHSKIYLMPVAIVMLILIGGALAITWLSEPGWILLAIVGISSVIPALDLAVTFTNRLITIFFPPNILPKMSFKSGIPDECKTLVVIPTLLTSPEDAQRQVEEMEVRALANPERNLQFVLLSDFNDANREQLTEDEKILKAAVESVDLLNHQYNHGSRNRFFLLHRKRQWNEKEGVWMGWERKRGKLEEFTRLLRDPDTITSFETIVGSLFDEIKDNAIKYVITLDADTQLPPGSAIDLIRTAAHPLNKPIYDEEKDRIVEGYGVLQPKIAIPPESASKSLFAFIYSGNVGLDPYTTAVSNTYQDFFDEGIYTGKGLYDVDVFYKLLVNKFPENTILSHDLLEGNYIRAALVSDLELYDDYPSTYKSFSKRQHRWIRGDWQILYWLFPKVPSPEGKQKNPLGYLGRWKIFDNLRRSITPFSILIFLVLGWTIFPGGSLFWTIAAIFIFGFPLYNDLITAIFRKSPRATWEIYFEKIWSDFKANSLQAAMSFVMLPHQAFIQLNAVFTTIWRMSVSKEKLLEWTSAYHTELEISNDLLDYYSFMKSAPIWGILTLILTDITHPLVLIFVSPIAASWIVAPLLAWYLSQPTTFVKKELSAEDIKKLRVYARRTWVYFYRFVGPENSWLPPDNVQEEPAGEPAPRTSPTNMGLGLLATQAAYDFGYLGRDELVFRLGEMLGSMRLLERYRGHFYNWYNTKIGAILDPAYISTVDSGNMAGSLLTLKQALLEINDKKWPNPHFFRGMGDTVAMLTETLKIIGHHIAISDTIKETRNILNEIDDLLPKKAPEKISDWITILSRLKPMTEHLSNLSLAAIRTNLGDKILEEVECCFEQPVKQVEGQLIEIGKIFKINNGFSDIPDSLNHLQPLNKLKDAIQLIQKKDVNNNGQWRHALETINNWLTTSIHLADWCNELVYEMDFSFLYFEDRNLFSIGYNVNRAELDESVYDLLASEARLASFISIAKGEIPPKHWFRMSRRLTVVKRNEILLSWGGTMFEYLMPLIFMRLYPGTLLSETYHNVVEWQRTYGARNNQPWGYSESAYYLLNLDFNYQYRAFGVPGLGLRRGLAEEYVVAPYATMLALMVDLQTSLKNLEEIKKEGAYGPLGFYEAIDYTKNRIPPDQKSGIVKSYMAHHQGMSLLSLSNVLLSNIMQERFHTDALVQSCELLLQERIPRGIPVTKFHPIQIDLEPSEQHAVHYYVDHVEEMHLDDPVPRVHLLSNGHMSTVITPAGTGYSSFDGYRLTRWKGDRTMDADGTFLYVRDLETGNYWSMGRQPAWHKPDRYDAWFHSGKVQIARVDNWIETFMEICVSPEDDIELRRYTITNYKDQPRRLDITSFAEIVLNDANADNAHPAFSKLFIQTDYLPEQHALIAKRRPRSSDDKPIWMVHVMACHDFESMTEPVQYETDRAKFIGRGRTLANPNAMDPDQPLSSTIGNVLDPSFSLRRIVELKPGEKIQVTLGIGAAYTREAAVAMADRFDNPYSVNRVFELSKVYGLIELENLDISIEQSFYFQKMASALLYGNPLLRSSEEELKKNRLQQAGLWAYGISGDLPLVVVHIKKFEEMKTIRTVLKAHQFWRIKGLQSDLLILNDHPASYADELQNAVLQAIQSSPERQYLNQNGGVFLRKTEGMPDQDLVLLHTVASMVLYGELPNLSLHEIDNIEDEEKTEEEVKETERKYQDALSSESDKSIRTDDKKEKTNIDDPPEKTGTDSKKDLSLFNDYGGFSKEGDEYIINVHVNAEKKEIRKPPMPWINVIANEQFGFIATEQGAGYTWSQNSRENRLTPWSNDPILDPFGEALYIRDEKRGIYWSPQPGPIPLNTDYEVHHGFGYTTCNVEGYQLYQKVTQFVPRHDPIKIVHVQLTNQSKRERHLSIYRYQEWVLGVLRNQSARYITSKFDESRRATLITNYYNQEFAGRIAFASLASDVEDYEFEFTCDRTEFVGRNRNLKNPAALNEKLSLSGKTGSKMDPCTTFRASFKMKPQETINFYFLLGESAQEDEVKDLIAKYQKIENIENAFTEIKDFWQNTLSTIQIQTPEKALDYMENGWLLYQNLACRIWARSAFYQSGGAFGYRDQLQDVTSLVYSLPEISREQILLHASHQFPEGDVLHWWHPPTGRGIRTKFSDDLLWLPYVTAFYIYKTGDREILGEELPFITARALDEGEDEAYLKPTESQEKASLYEHCCHAIDRSLTTGAHGLPLMGTGDWNDGMNKVGYKGKGESVWLGFFLYDILSNFIPIAESQNDDTRKERFYNYREKLRNALNTNGWDGEWFRRAYFDDGTPLGSKENEECQIDSIAQSWSIISGAAEPEKAEKAMDAVEQKLVWESEGLIRLLTPPFDQTSQNPGYIKGYVPGVRENGGQYTHAALWVVKALAEMGRGDRAGTLLTMLSPVSHSQSKEDVDKFKVEPYSIPADIYGVSPYVGRGGWTWYTGSAGWMYRIVLESLLGFELTNGNHLTMNPCIPKKWEGFTIRYHHLESHTDYLIQVKNPDKVEKGIKQTILDDKVVKNNEIILPNDGQSHKILVTMG